MLDCSVSDYYITMASLLKLLLILYILHVFGNHVIVKYANGQGQNQDVCKFLFVFLLYLFFVIVLFINICTNLG